MVERSEMESVNAGDGVRWSTVFAEGMWLAVAMLILFVRDGSLFLTAMGVAACVAALLVVVKDEIVKARWIVPLNLIVAIMPILLLGLFLLTVQSSELGPNLYLD